MNTEVEKLVNLLNEQGKMVFKSPVLSQEIEEFEINNAIKFPKEFCNWLKFSDGGEFFLPAGVQIYGIKNPPLIDINNEQDKLNKEIEDKIARWEYLSELYELYNKERQK